MIIKVEKALPPGYTSTSTVDDSPPNPGSCGGCTLCCTVMRVQLDPPDEPKPELVTCKYLNQGCKGCSIYEKRPDVCRNFECLWLGSQRWDKVAWKSHERPDRTGVVMDVNSKGTVIVHCKTPEAWRNPVVMRRIEALNRDPDTPITIEHGDGRVTLVEKDGSYSAMEYIGTDPQSDERMYRRKR